MLRRVKGREDGENEQSPGKAAPKAAKAAEKPAMKAHNEPMAAKKKGESSEVKKKIGEGPEQTRRRRPYLHTFTE